MIDLDLLRNNPEEVKANLALRGYDLNISQWRTLEENRKVFQVKMENSQAKQIRQRCRRCIFGRSCI